MRKYSNENEIQNLQHQKRQHNVRSQQSYIPCFLEVGPAVQEYHLQQGPQHAETHPSHPSTWSTLLAVSVNVKDQQ